MLNYKITTDKHYVPIIKCVTKTVQQISSGHHITSRQTFDIKYKTLDIKVIWKSWKTILVFHTKCACSNSITNHIHQATTDAERRDAQHRATRYRDKQNLRQQGHPKSPHTWIYIKTGPRWRFLMVHVRKHLRGTFARVIAPWWMRGFNPWKSAHMIQ